MFDSTFPQHRLSRCGCRRNLRDADTLTRYVYVCVRACASFFERCTVVFASGQGARHRRYIYRYMHADTYVCAKECTRMRARCNTYRHTGSAGLVTTLVSSSHPLCMRRRYASSRVYDQQRSLMCNYLMRGLGPARSRMNIASSRGNLIGDSGHVLNYCRRGRVAHRYSQRGNI